MPIGCHVPSKRRRPTVSVGCGSRKFRPIGLPSLVDSMGRNTVCSYSEDDGGIIGGVDVAGAQRFSMAAAMWAPYMAGLGTDGTNQDQSYKKTSAFREGPEFAILLTGGVNFSGGVFYRAIGDSYWTLTASTLKNKIDDGGSSDPRPAGTRRICIDGDYVYISGYNSSGTMGVARGNRSTPGSGPINVWNNTFIFDASREVTAIVKSQQWNCLYMTCGYRGSPSTATQGVWAVRNITGTPTLDKIDDTGTGDARDGGVLIDVRDCLTFTVNNEDHVYVVVGNRSGSDANRGVWRAIISADPTAGNLTNSDIVWEKLYTPTSVAERMNVLVGYQPNGYNTSPVHIMASTFKPTDLATGQYPLSQEASS